jgi:diaminopimelate decarboxylase
MTARVHSPNTSIRPVTAQVEKNHLLIGGCDSVDLAAEFGTPLYVLDRKTIEASISAYRAGLTGYQDDAHILYAGKAFLCTAMCHLLRRLGTGLDVVSQGELLTAMNADFPAELIYMHGNNKSETEIRRGLLYGDVRIVVDNLPELAMVEEVAKGLSVTAKILLRLTPDVEPKTHKHIKTGHAGSKFGLAPEQLDEVAEAIRKNGAHLDLIGLHSHIGSQSHEMEPFLESLSVVSDCFELLRTRGFDLTELDVGGGLGIAYVEADEPTAIEEWTRAVAGKVTEAFQALGRPSPRLLVEPGRTVVGPAGVTLYRVGHKKVLPNGTTHLAVDGGMADNPRPITYQAQYTAVVANRMNSAPSMAPVTLAGKYCESGDIIIEETYIAAESGDLIAVFGTGAYNYSMASNYNRTGRPACVLVADGKAEVIIERETSEDLLRFDRVPDSLR